MFQIHLQILLRFHVIEYVDSCLLSCSILLEKVESFNAVNMGSVGKRAIKLQAFKLEGLKTSLLLGPWL